MPEHSTVSSHLQIRLDEYDAKIRTFVPYYEEMLDVASNAFARMARPQSILLELGIGTGALSGRCRALRPDVSIVGIDADADILAMARDRLGTDRVELRAGNFTNATLPQCDAIVSSLALHHVGDAEEKRELYRRCHSALDRTGCMVIADCFLPAAAEHMLAASREWQSFLESHYSPGEAKDLLDAWAREDTYFPLMDELASLTDAGFRTDVVWRRGMFGVVVCTRSGTFSKGETQ